MGESSPPTNEARPGDLVSTLHSTGVTGMHGYTKRKKFGCQESTLRYEGSCSVESCPCVSSPECRPSMELSELEGEGRGSWTEGQGGFVVWDPMPVTLFPPVQPQRHTGTSGSWDSGKIQNELSQSQDGGAGRPCSRPCSCWLRLL